MNTGVPRGRIAPRLEPDVEHPLPDQDRPGRGIHLIHDRVIGLGLRIELPIVEPVLFHKPLVNGGVGGRI
jgi:hypothetical protein